LFEHAWAIYSKDTTKFLFFKTFFINV
jgi:hypothetical protein